MCGYQVYRICDTSICDSTFLFRYALSITVCKQLIVYAESASVYIGFKVPCMCALSVYRIIFCVRGFTIVNSLDDSSNNGLLCFTRRQ